ncbi:hypothetical protein GGQ22_08075 [Nocardioides sp. zg-579]|uniref:Bacterial Ig-like domain-containing protein n=1 Tax=Nocardioides marmotae TaxID=2663857 RepID=A0A6I3J6E4_9ACTN|nr:Ig-like domain repeat protein [Nocardioides marmotae]MCR6031403.1 hypothetical protein [Gordonia jinghuaiqii]MTB95042.1 hypothetical protein [Nocardioides marmotae]QKE02460.1 Ig-like domain repeat protein [Nocardioides marmotae]
MTTSAVTKRLAATGLATALATGAMVAGTAAPASAAVSGGATFSCTLPILNLPVDVPLSLSADALPTDVLADFDVPGGLVPVLGELQIGGLLGLLGNLPLPITELGAGLPGFSMLLGTLPIPLDGLESAVGPLSQVAGLAGTVGSFKTPAAGTYDVKLPSSFDLKALGLPGPLEALVPAFPCTIKDGQNPVVGTVKVNKQSAAMNAKALKKTVKKGKPAKVAAAVVRQDGKVATGKVVAILGGKKVASKHLQNGRATLSVAKLGKGTKKIVVKYLGNGSTASVQKAVKVIVKK